MKARNIRTGCLSMKLRAKTTLNLKRNWKNPNCTSRWVVVKMLDREKCPRDWPRCLLKQIAYQAAAQMGPCRRDCSSRSINLERAQQGFQTDLGAEIAQLQCDAAAAVE